MKGFLTRGPIRFHSEATCHQGSVVEGQPGDIPAPSSSPFLQAYNAPEVPREWTPVGKALVSHGICLHTATILQRQGPIRARGPAEPQAEIISSSASSVGSWPTFSDSQLSAQTYGSAWSSCPNCNFTGTGHM